MAETSEHDENRLLDIWCNASLTNHYVFAGVVAVDGAVDREESLEEQPVDVVELADPQPAPVNASAANGVSLRLVFFLG